MKTPPKKAPPRARGGVAFIELGALHSTLMRIADRDAHESGEPINMSRTVRRLIREEARRRGIPDPNP